MDEIDALNEEWHKIKGRNLNLDDVSRGNNSNSSDTCNSSSRRRKKSRWSDEKVTDYVSSAPVDNDVKTAVVVNDFSQNISKLVEERKNLERLAQEKSDAEIQPSNGSNTYAASSSYGSVIDSPERQNTGPRSFRLIQNEDVGKSSQSYGFQQRKNYRFKKDSSNSDSETESPVVKTTAFNQITKDVESHPREDSGLSPYLEGPAAPEATPVGPFLEKKTTVIVKNVADWVTAAHILQDVKNAQLKSFEDFGIVRKRERGSPYRYAYVDFLTNTSARRWIDIRKGKVVVGSQSFPMELSLPDWECPNCKVFNFGKSVLCYSCRTPKNILLQTTVQ